MIILKLLKLFIFSTILLFVAVPNVAIMRLFNLLVEHYPNILIFTKEVF
ncbi:MAG: hypothetical protein QM479_14440 [Pseudomonadota bacterium]